MFDSIFNTYHGAPILCGTITGFMRHHHRFYAAPSQVLCGTITGFMRHHHRFRDFLLLFLGFLELHLRQPWQGKKHVTMVIYCR